MNTKYILCIENNNEVLKGYIIPEQHLDYSKDDIINLADIIFDPLTILGDLEYICKDISITSDMPDFHISNSALFQEPYSIEPCFNMKIEHNVEYFTLLKIIKNIIINDVKLSFVELKNLDSYLNLHIPYTFSDKDNGDVFTPRVYGLYDLENINAPVSSSHIYTCPCDSISEMVYAVFTYLVLQNYHFYKCEHCHRYSAIKRKQGTQKYCFRNNILNIPKYEGDSCANTVNKFLDKIRARKKKIYKYLYDKGEDIELSETKSIDEYIYFQNQYKEHMEIIQTHGATPENLIAMYDFIEDNAKEVNRRKKERG